MEAFNIVLQVIKWIIIFLDIVLLGATAYVFKQTLKYRPHFTSGGEKGGGLVARRERVKERWGLVAAKFAKGTDDGMKLSIIDADKLIDSLLKEAGLPGEHMGDRLEQLSASELVSLKNLWRAHRLRNEIVHSPDFQLNHELAQRTLSDYKAFLVEMDLLE